MNKVDIWVVVRLEGDAVKFADLVSVKAVFDSERDASESASRARAAMPEAEYLVIRSRRFVDETTEPRPKNSPTRVQGFDTSGPPRRSTHEMLKTVDQLRKMFDDDSARRARRVLLPILSYAAEQIVASALGGSLQPDGSPADVQLPTGELVEVKTAVLTKDQRRAPTIHLRTDDRIQFLAIVIFRPDFAIHQARLFPSNSLDRFIRKENGPQDWGMLRVTPDVLNAPGSQDIGLQ